MSTNAEATGAAVRLRALQRCLSDRHTGLLHYRLDSVCDLAENLPEGWPAGNLLGSKGAELLPPEVAAPIEDARAQALATGEPQVTEVEVRGPPRRLFRVQLTPDREENGRVAGLFTVLTDVTEARERELAVKGLLREVSHRSKNMLAIVQAVAMQTASNSGDGEFLEKFRGRVQALASAQDLITESNWRGARFADLAAAQLARVDRTAFRIADITGDNPLLRPNAALHVGLAIHELASNALRYGALRNRDTGRIGIMATVVPMPGKRRVLTIDWAETGAEPRSPRATHFGTAVLEHIVPVSVSGSAYYEIGQNRVTYRLSMPASQFEA